MKDYLNPLNLQPIKSIFLSTYLPEISNGIDISSKFLRQNSDRSVYD